MASLVSFPFKNQNTTILQDGSIDGNGPFDCVSESIAAGMQYLTGQSFEGGILKELIYGADYQGGQAASAYVQYCAHYGVQLYPVDDTLINLTAIAHRHIQAAHPVLLTIVDPYVDTSLPQFAGWTHVVVLYSEAPGLLVAMDPFIADSVSKSDGTWQQVMAENEIWILEKVNQDVAISLTTPNVGTYYRQGSNSGAWSCVTLGHTYQVGGAILTFYRTLGNAGLCGLTHLGLPVSGEYSLHINGHPEIVAQDFERGRLVFDPGHVFDRPPGAGAVYFAHEAAITTGVSDEAYKTLQGELQGAQNQLKALQGKITKLQEDLK